MSIPKRTFTDEEGKVLQKKRDRIFGVPVNDEHVDEMSVKRFTDPMEKNINWVLKMYREWRDNSNSDIPNIYCDLEDVSTLAQDNLLYALCRFVCKVGKKKDGAKFPPKTLRYIILMI